MPLFKSRTLKSKKTLRNQRKIRAMHNSIGGLNI
jgi:hypothetical protein